MDTDTTDTSSPEPNTHQNGYWYYRYQQPWTKYTSEWLLILLIPAALNQIHINMDTDTTDTSSPEPNTHQNGYWHYWYQQPWTKYTSAWILILLIPVVLKHKYVSATILIFQRQSALIIDTEWRYFRYKQPWIRYIFVTATNSASDNSNIWYPGIIHF
jgi:hypothetical protein